MRTVLTFPVNPDHFIGMIKQIVMPGVEVDYRYQKGSDALSPVVWPLIIAGWIGAETENAETADSGHFTLEFETEADMAQRLARDLERIKQGELQN